MRRFLTDTVIAALVAFAATPAALAQVASPQVGTVAGGNVDVVREDRISLDEWGYGGLYEEGTWTAEQLFDAPVYGPEGEEIGEVENIIVGTDGYVQAIIAEVGGFWDIGDTHVRVPWAEAEVEMLAEGARVQVPVTEETVENYDVYGGIGGEFRVVDDDNPYTPRGWRATELIDDYVTLEDGQRYGWVEDLVFGENGRLEAVVVDAVHGGAYGPYAYPFYGYGYGFYPGYNYYGLPYTADEVAGTGMEPFEYDRFETAEVAED